MVQGSLPMARKGFRRRMHRRRAGGEDAVGFLIEAVVGDCDSSGVQISKDVLVVRGRDRVPAFERRDRRSVL